MTTRLEYHDDYTNSHKYYELIDIGKKTEMVLVRWGRCGSSRNDGQDVIGGEQIIDYLKAVKKLKEKKNKGYVNVY